MSLENFKDLIDNSEDISAKKAKEVVKQFEELRKLAEEKSNNKADEKPVIRKEKIIIDEEETKSLPPATKYDSSWID